MDVQFYRLNNFKNKLTSICITNFKRVHLYLSIKYQTRLLD